MRSPAHRQQEGQGGAAQVHREIPDGAGGMPPDIQPVQVEPALVDAVGGVAARHAGEHALGGGAADDGEARLRMAAQQVVEQPRGQDGIADPVGGDEQDSLELGHGTSPV
jgi:hypothetical protein